MSTLLKSLGAVIEPTAGRMILGGEIIYDDGWKVKDLRALRRDKIGFVFQAPYLIPFLNVNSKPRSSSSPMTKRSYQPSSASTTSATE